MARPHAEPTAAILPVDGLFAHIDSRLQDIVRE